MFAVRPERRTSDAALGKSNRGAIRAPAYDNSAGGCHRAIPRLGFPKQFSTTETSDDILGLEAHLSRVRAHIVALSRSCFAAAQIAANTISLRLQSS
jgi:hypothetical protein